MNRLDRVVVFHGLSPAQLGEILDIELAQVQDRIQALSPEHGFKFNCTPETKAFLIREGTDAKYGARPLKRAIERHVVLPMARLLSTMQISSDDTVTIDIVPGKTELVFLKEDPVVKVCEPQPKVCYDELWEYYASAYEAQSSLSEN
jgi:ATP-dependent Clp protease ATP-binding subunit ClpA